MWLTTDTAEGMTSSDGRGQLLEWICRRQRRVVRSTFSAELNGVIDSVEAALLVQMALHQIYRGTAATAKELAGQLETGQLYPPVDAVTDARSVFDAVQASDPTDPQECSLKLHLLSLRDRLTTGTLRKFWWCDTRDMLADGLTKGGVDRALLERAAEKGLYMAQHVSLCCSK